MRFTKVLISSAVVVAAFSGTQAVAAGPTLSDVLGNSGITLGGTVDASYDWSPNDAVGAFHAFDTERDAFSLHQINLTASKAFANGVGATVNVLGGDDATVTGGGGDEFDVVQGFLSYTAGDFTAMGGRFVTLAGMEVINSSGNLNASRSALFYFQPLRHEGVRGTYKVNDLASVTLGLVNSQFGGSRFDENNTDTTIEAQVALTPMKNLSIYLTGYTGNEDAGGPGDDADLNSDTIDLVVNFQATDALYVGINADYFNTEGDAGGEGGGGGGHFETKGIAGYVGFKFLPQWRVAVRSEYITAEAGGGQGDDILRTNTVTFGYAVSENLEILAEGRHDRATGSRDANTTFANINHSTFGGEGGFNEDDQYTATLKAILKF